MSFLTVLPPDGARVVGLCALEYQGNKELLARYGSVPEDLSLQRSICSSGYSKLRDLTFHRGGFCRITCTIPVADLVVQNCVQKIMQELVGPMNMHVLQLSDRKTRGLYMNVCSAAGILRSREMNCPNQN